MFCSNCGTELPNEANFCLNCGVALKSGVSAAKSQWEMCEIKENTIKGKGLFSSDMYELEAVATGPKGTYTVGRSSPWKPGLDYKEREPYLNGLRAKLSADGWEPIERGDWWCDYRFRRRVG